MTTIAVRDGVLACDSLVTEGGMLCGYAQKARQAADGSAMAMTGALSAQAAAFAWYDAGADPSNVPPAFDEGSELIVLRPDGQVVYYAGGREMHIAADFHASGTGRAVALGAMHVGASAREAVEAAVAFDLCTGGDVVTLEPVVRR